MNPYRQRVWKIIEEMLPARAPIANALDFGSGDGWFARQMERSGWIENLTAVDIKRRDNVLFEPTIYDGDILPYAPRQFELVYSIDVLHHCPDPAAQLREILGCSSRYFLLKDHNYRTPVGQLELAVLDEIGNRKFGIPSLYQYQKRWEWFDIARSEGFELRKLVYPAPVHIGALGVLTNALQFVALWERT